MCLKRVFLRILNKQNPHPNNPRPESHRPDQIIPGVETQNFASQRNYSPSIFNLCTSQIHYAGNQGN
jgi:hypothetical protein